MEFKLMSHNSQVVINLSIPEMVINNMAQTKMVHFVAKAFQGVLMLIKKQIKELN